MQVILARSRGSLLDTLRQDTLSLTVARKRSAGTAIEAFRVVELDVEEVHLFTLYKAR
jgi:hypothetical protein